MRPLRAIMLSVTGLRRFFNGTGPYSGVAGGAFLLALAMLLAVLLSPHGWQWWLDAHAVHGHESGGVVTYSFDGQNWSVDDTRSLTRSGPRTVYVIAAAPYDGSLTNTPTVILDWALIAGPCSIGAGLLGLGFIRRSGTRRRQVEVDRGRMERHGHSIPSHLIREILAERAADTSRRGN